MSIRIGYNLLTGEPIQIKPAAGVSALGFSLDLPDRRSPRVRRLEARLYELEAIVSRLVDDRTADQEAADTQLAKAIDSSK